MTALILAYWWRPLWMLRIHWPLTQGLSGRGPALVNLPIETGLSHGGMCCLLRPNVGCRVSCAVLPAIVPWVSTLSGWQMTILRTCVVSMTYTSYMASQQWIALGEFVFFRRSHWEVAYSRQFLVYAGVSAPPLYSLGIAMPWRFLLFILLRERGVLVASKWNSSVRSCCTFTHLPFVIFFTKVRHANPIASSST